MVIERERERERERESVTLRGKKERKSETSHNSERASDQDREQGRTTQDLSMMVLAVAQLKRTIAARE
jgi:hypothetical protein